VLRLHQHQREAIEAARTGGSYVLTTGSGSGKSLLVSECRRTSSQRVRDLSRGVAIAVVSLPCAERPADVWRMQLAMTFTRRRMDRD